MVRVTESREVRNKRVALDAIAILERVIDQGGDPYSVRLARAWKETQAFHQRWCDRGVLWTRPTMQPFDLDTWLPAEDVAELADVTAKTVRSWQYRGHITAGRDNEGRPLYNVGEVLRYQARRVQAKRPA